MTKDKILQYCHRLEPTSDYTGLEVNDNVVMTYRGEVVLEIDDISDYVTTIQGRDHFGEHKMSESDWHQVKVFVEVE